MKKSMLLMMVLMFSIQSYGVTYITVIDTVFILNADKANAPLDGDTIKAYKNGVLKTQNITSTQGSIHGRCILNVSMTTVGDTIKLVPVSPLGANNTPIFTFKQTQIITVIRSLVSISNTNTTFFANRNVTSIAPSIFNTSKSNTGSIAYYDLQGKIVKSINKNQGTYIQAVKGTYIKEVKVY